MCFWIVIAIYTGLAIGSAIGSLLAAISLSLSYIPKTVCVVAAIFWLPTQLSSSSSPLARTCSQLVHSDGRLQALMTVLLLHLKLPSAGTKPAQRLRRALFRRTTPITTLEQVLNGFVSGGRSLRVQVWRRVWQASERARCISNGLVRECSADNTNCNHLFEAAGKLAFEREFKNGSCHWLLA